MRILQILIGFGAVALNVWVKCIDFTSANGQATLFAQMIAGAQKWSLPFPFWSAAVCYHFPMIAGIGLIVSASLAMPHPAATRR